MAWSSPRPASTLTTSKSSASGRDSRIRCCLFFAIRPSAMLGSRYAMPAAPSDAARFGRQKNSGNVVTKKQRNANPIRMLKKTQIASCRRYPAASSFFWSFPVSAADLGAISPRRFSRSAIMVRSDFRSTTVPLAISNRRCSTTAEARGVRAMPAPKMSSETKTNPSNGNSSVTSHLDLDDVSNPEVPDRLENDGAGEHYSAHRLAKQELHLFGSDRRQRYGERGGKSEQHVPREAAMRGVRADLAANLEPFADDAREILEDLGQVAAAFALNGHGGHEEAHVEERNAFRDPVERLFQWKSEILLVEYRSEFGANGRAQFVGNHAQGRLECVACANGARHEIERIGKLFFELIHADRPAPHQPDTGSREPDQGGRGPHERRAEEEPGHQPQGDACADADQDDRAGCRLDARLRNQAAQ